MYIVFYRSNIVRSCQAWSSYVAQELVRLTPTFSSSFAFSLLSLRAKFFGLAPPAVDLKHMGSYATISIDKHEVFYYKNEVNPELLFLFDEKEKTFLKGKDAFDYDKRRNIEDYDPEDVDDVEVHVYQSGVRTIRDRLRTLGFNETLLESIFDECRNEQIEHSTEMLADYEKSSYDHAADMRKMYSEQLAMLEDLTFTKWLANVKKYVTGSELSSQREGALELIESANERVVMFAIILSVDPSSTIELDVSDLYEGGWLSDMEASESNTDLSWSLATTPPIVLTEGVFDRQVLIDSLSLLRPELASYLRFLDTDYKTEGGASAILKMMKSFAAAGISNRILLILDNDTAAHEAMSAIKSYRLPSHFGIMMLPKYELLESYPTIGPQGTISMDINGLAAAIELYLGKDVLTNVDLALSPVQWTGYSNKMFAYQGELNEKSMVQKRFKEKVKAAKSDPSLIEHQDWSGIELIIEKIILELSTLR